MARKPVTQDEVSRAAQTLREGGEEPTVRAVIAMVGGSASTVTGMLDVWRKAADERDALAEVAVPDELTRVLSEAGARVWSMAQGIARSGHQAIQRELALVRTEFQRDRAELLGLMAEAENERDQALEAVEASKLETASLRSEAEKARQGSEIEQAKSDAAMTVLREGLASAEQRADREAEGRRQAEAEVARLTERLAVQDAEVARLQAQLAAQKPQESNVKDEAATGGSGRP